VFSARAGTFGRLTDRMNVMQRCAFILCLAMCLVAQLAAAVVPQGARMCVRPVVGLSISHDSAGSGEAHRCCCCNESNGGPQDDAPVQGPCREPDCLLCLSVPAASFGSGKALLNEAAGVWAIMAVVPPAMSQAVPDCCGMRLAPRAGVPPRCGPPMVGCVILQV
jgi:hypothetical protein